MRNAELRLAITMALLALGGCVTPIDANRADREAAVARDLADALEGRVAGKARDCMSMMSASGPQIIGDRTLIYRSGRTLWRNDLPDRCPGMDNNDFLVVQIRGSQLCRNDLVTPTSRGSGIPGPSCRLGLFTPYTKP